MIDNRFQLVNILGKGASSKVFLAKDETEATYAVKVISPSPQISYRLGCAMAQREHEVLEYFEGHPNILRSFGVNLQGVISNGDRSEGVIYNLLEHATNGAIANFIRYTGALEEDVAKFFAVQMCHAIDYIHRNEFVHLDIKLENILLDDHFNVKIADMGCAMNVSATQSRSNKRRGTMQYMAPEVKYLKEGESYDAFSADIYSLGVAIYVLLIGEFPNNSESNSRCLTMESEPQTPRDHLSSIDSVWKARWNNLSEEARELIEGMMTADVNKRLKMEDILKSSWLSSFQQTESLEKTYLEMSARKECIRAYLTQQS